MSRSQGPTVHHLDFDVPPHLQRATLRLSFPPSYVVVGVYRLFTDESLYKPAWDKCRHGARRGLTVGLIWVRPIQASRARDSVSRKFRKSRKSDILSRSKACLTFKVQKFIIRVILKYPSSLFSFSYLTRLSDTATDLSEETFLDVTILLLGSQVTSILTFFLSRNIRIARQRAWDQTVASRGKGPEFWKPYVEEWDVPPLVQKGFGAYMSNIFKSWIVGMVIKKVLLLPLSLYPFVGTFMAAGFKAMGTAKYLHKPYFKAKNMTPYQEAVFIEERKWDYRFFGFVAVLLEQLPIIGLAFIVSNRIGAAMWAHGGPGEASTLHRCSTTRQWSGRYK